MPLELDEPTITVRFTFPGTHRWPDAPLCDEWGYLAHPHRHVFHVELEVPVTHDDRELEFHALLQAVAVWPERFEWLAGSAQLGTRSCEQIAGEVIGWADNAYPDRPWWRCTVTEDGENGATVYGRNVQVPQP